MEDAMGVENGGIYFKFRSFLKSLTIMKIKIVFGSVLLVIHSVIIH